MPHVTTILGNEVGIQYQGTRDASSLMGAAQVSGLIVGQFKRGRLDQPMTITLENVKGTLGEDLDNPDYLAVLDALAGGVPSVQVMRVNGGGGGRAFCQIGPKYNKFFIINLLEGETGNRSELLNRIVNEATVSISGQKLVKTDNQGSKGYYRIENIDDSYVRITVNGYGDVELRDYDVVICTPVQVVITPEYQ